MLIVKRQAVMTLVCYGMKGCVLIVKHQAILTPVCYGMKRKGLPLSPPPITGEN